MSDRVERFWTFFTKNREELLRYASRLLEEREDVEDLVSDSCLKIVKGLSNNCKFPPNEDEYIYWHKRCIKNLFLDQERRENRFDQERFILESEDIQYHNNLCEAFSKFMHNGARQMLGDEKYELLQMRIEGYTYDEIAEQSELSESTVRRRIKECEEIIKQKHPDFLQEYLRLIGRRSSWN